MLEVKKGGHVSYTCDKCGKEIAKGEAHMRGGGKPFKRYHTACAEAITAKKTEKKERRAKKAAEKAAAEPGPETETIDE
jgi:hypothetical protein